LASLSRLKKIAKFEVAIPSIAVIFVIWVICHQTDTSFISGFLAYLTVVVLYLNIEQADDSAMYEEPLPRQHKWHWVGFFLLLLTTVFTWH
jgi:hypothetical protein